MRYCPTCYEQFNEDLHFCLHDGTPLVAEPSQAVFSPRETQSLNFCGNCAAPLSSEYTFCKKCGTPRSKFEKQNRARGPATTITGNKESNAIFDSGSWFEQNKPLVIGASVVAVLLVVIGIYYASSGVFNGDGSNPVASSNNSNRPAYPPNRVSTTPIPTPNQNYSRTETGKTGRVATDLNIRNEPNKYAVSVGIHYRGARFRVLESTTYQTPEGEMSTWYRVEIYEYGCSVDTNLGCGKNSDADRDTGWINAKYVLMD
jgi:hypothetical protein